MVHGIYKVTSFRIVGDYTLRVQFDDGSAQTIDFRPILAGPIYGRCGIANYSSRYE